MLQGKIGNSFGVPHCNCRDIRLWRRSKGVTRGRTWQAPSHIYARHSAAATRTRIISHPSTMLRRIASHECGNLGALACSNSSLNRIGERLSAMGSLEALEPSPFLGPVRSIWGERMGTQQTSTPHESFYDSTVQEVGPLHPVCPVKAGGASEMRMHPGVMEIHQFLMMSRFPAVACWLPSTP